MGLEQTMATVESDLYLQETSVAAEVAPGDRPAQVNHGLHRLRAVRRRQGVSLRTVARHLGADLREVRRQEDEWTDLRLSDLYRWQAVLDVPLVELLAEPESPLSRPVMERASLVRVMKTATAILEQADTSQLRRLATMLVEQLIALMPELKNVGPWHSVGQRRGLAEFGRIAEHSLPDEVVTHPPLDRTE